MGISLAVQWFRIGLPMQADASSIPGWGATNPNPIPHVLGPKKKNKPIKQKKYCHKFNKDFKKWSTSKNKN